MTVFLSSLHYLKIHLSIEAMPSTSGNKSSGKRSKRIWKETDFQAAEALQVWVAVERPNEGRFYHWSIAVFDVARGAWHTYEAARAEADGPFESNYRSTDPRDSNCCIKPMTLVSHVDGSLYDGVFAAINQVRIPSDTTNWNCQNYVQEVLSGLVKSNLVEVSAVETASAQLALYWGEMSEDFAAAEPPRDPGRVLSDEYVVDSDSDGK